MLFSRVPDYFEGEFITGTVLKAGFSIKDNHPVLVVVYKIGNEKFTCTTNKWFLTPHVQGQSITLIYNPSNPVIVSIYAIIGYWINWDELFFTGIVFIILFIAAVIITGKNNVSRLANEEQNRKRKYDD